MKFSCSGSLLPMLHVACLQLLCTLEPWLGFVQWSLNIDWNCQINDCNQTMYSTEILCAVSG